MKFYRSGISFFLYIIVLCVVFLIAFFISIIFICYFWIFVLIVSCSNCLSLFHNVKKIYSICRYLTFIYLIRKVFFIKLNHTCSAIKHIINLSWLISITCYAVICIITAIVLAVILFFIIARLIHVVIAISFSLFAVLICVFVPILIAIVSIKSVSYFS